MPSWVAAFVTCSSLLCKTFTDFFPSQKIVTGDHSTYSIDMAKKELKEERGIRLALVAFDYETESLLRRLFRRE